MSEEIKESYLKLPNVRAGELQDVVDFMEDNDIEYIEFYEKDLKQQILDLQQKVEQLENIRKEAIKFLENEENIIDIYYKHDFRKYPDYDPFNAKDEEDVRCAELYGYNELLNILNKGSDKE